MSDINQVINPQPNTVTTSQTSTPQTPPPQTNFIPSAEELLKTPEVKAIIEKVRTQEKEKLYKSLESKDGEIVRLKEEAEGLRSQLTTKENENLSEMQVLQKQISELKDGHRALIASLESEREAEKEKRRKAELVAYKERRLREVGDDLVVSLVGGNSEDEIENSITFAAQEFQNIVNKAMEKAKQQAAATTPTTKPSTGTPRVTNPHGMSGTPLSRDVLKSMSLSDYAAQRDKIRELAKYGQIIE